MHSRRKVVFRTLVYALVAALTSSCATVDQVMTDRGTEIGCVAGGIAGAVGGYFVGQKLGNRAAGTAIGGLVGGGLGCYLGNRWQKRERALRELARREKLELQTEALSVAAASQPGTPAPFGGTSNSGSVAAAPAQTTPPAEKDSAGLVASIQSGSMFDTDSDQFTPDGMRQAQALAQIYKPESPAQAGQQAESSALLVVGHTDATGPAEYNQSLSERRARTMGRVLAEAGISPSRVYFQGAGSGRPIADNSTEEGRARNRRVEIVALDSSDLLVQRIRQEQASPKYLAHGTSTKPVATPQLPAESSESQSAAGPESPPPVAAVAPPPGFVDFGGQPIAADSSNLASYVKPRQAGFSLINTAYAAPVIAQDCHLDSPRIVGAVKNLATDQPLDSHETRDYVDGMNGRAWAGLVNGNLVTMSPVAVLRDNATVVKNPDTFVTPNYSNGRRKHSNGLRSVANTFEGEDTILYRVFVQPEDAPLEVGSPGTELEFAL